jgi:hypothetical protein
MVTSADTGSEAFRSPDVEPHQPIPLPLLVRFRAFRDGVESIKSDLLYLGDVDDSLSHSARSP